MNALIDSNKQFRQFTYPNRAHSLVNPLTGETNQHLYRMITNILQQTLAPNFNEKLN
jgi:hypothetical protein